MEGGFCLFIHTGVVNNQLTIKHFASESEAIAAAKEISTKAPTQYVAVVPNIFYLNCMEERKKSG